MPAKGTGKRNREIIHKLGLREAVASTPAARGRTRAQAVVRELQHIAETMPLKTTMPERDRRMLMALMGKEPVKSIAAREGVSEGLVSGRLVKLRMLLAGAFKRKRKAARNSNL